MTKRTRMTEFTDEDFISIREVARNIVALPEFSESEQKDFEQDLALGLFLASKNFRSKNGKWATFRGDILSKLACKIKRERWQKSSRFKIPTSISLNSPIKGDSEFPDEVPTLMDSVSNEHTLADGTEDDGVKKLGVVIDVQFFVSGLPTKLKKVCEMLMEGCTQREISKRLKVCQTTVCRYMADIRERMINVGLDEYLPVFHAK